MLSPRHGTAQAELTTEIAGAYGLCSRGRGPGGWIFATDVEILFAPDQIFRPDVTGWHRECLPKVPDESPITIRKRTYHQHQVPHYWLLDPVRETLSVLRWSPDGFIEILSAIGGERVRAEPFDAIEISVGVFFGDDDE
jgi:hypothetical protein